MLIEKKPSRVRTVTVVVVEVNGVEITSDDYDSLESLYNADGFHDAVVLYDDEQMERFERAGFLRRNASGACWGSRLLKENWGAIENAVCGGRIE